MIVQELGLFKKCVLLVMVVMLGACNRNQGVYEFPDHVRANYVHELNNQLTEAILQDGFSPPVAARAYAYSNIAAYEVMRLKATQYRSMAGQLNGLDKLPTLEAEKVYDFDHASIVAFVKTAKAMVYRDYLMDVKAEELLKSKGQFQLQTPLVLNSEALGNAIADAIIEWSKSDNYAETRGLPLYVPSRAEGAWQPTPPTYADAIEPHWGEIRAFVLDSANQVVSIPPAEFDKSEGSEFHRLVMETYDAVKNLDAEKTKIAKHWDCNPFVSINRGHLMYGKRQLTPGGHWMGICRTALKMEKKTLPECFEAYMMTGIALHDGFISCWYEKYRSNTIRPETYINRYLDKQWRPLLETPMFPEHTSGHSVVSNSAATILTQLIGDNFVYIDSVNVPLGLPPRSFTSFFNASEEAAISRLYGGIHYMPSIDGGVTQGKEVGKLIVENVKTR